MYRFNGERWYKAPVWYKRIRRWFIWIGGWEKANATGWRFYITNYRPNGSVTKEQIEYLNSLKTVVEKNQYLKTIPHKKHRIWLGPTPISLFGNRITIQNFGIYISVKSGWLVIEWKKRLGRKCYISPDGTPTEAHTWYWGTPREILQKSILTEDGE